MAELFIFTLLATIVAIYRVLPRYRQLRVTYTLWNKPIAGLLTALGLTVLVSYAGSIYLQNTDNTTLWSLKTAYTQSPIEITSLEIEFIQLAATITIMGVFLGVFLSKSVRIRNEQMLLSALRDLYNRGEYATLVEVLRDNYTPLIDHPEKPTPPSEQQWRDIDVTVTHTLIETEEAEELDDSSPLVEYVEEDNEEQSARERVRDTFELKRRQATYYLAMLRYRLADSAEDSSSYTETLLLDPELGAKYPIIDPGLGIDIILDIELDGFQRRDVTHQYLTTLLREKNSLLYQEISNNMTMDGIHRYRVNPDNRLLHALFSDCSRAEELDAYRPIGDTAKEMLRDQGTKEYDKYNAQRLTSVSRSKDYVFNDPIFVAISFFDIMVREALYQRIDWHMWLYYYESMTRLMCENYKNTEETDPDSEWPNDYSRFMYEMISNMGDLLRIMERMVENDEYDVTNEDGNYEEFIALESYRRNRGGTIPKSAVEIMLSCHQEILTTAEIPHQFKKYITEIIFTRCSELREYEEESLPWKYSEFMLKRLDAMIEGRPGSEYHRELESVYNDGVRHEIVAKGITGGWIVDELDELIQSS
ncbi:hypothetical protein [Haloarcula japonica]|uniref:Uncharacterized protein n=1 Tax=Haloarcula japonica (strain ATCC 49778 / DSM 6131 / JCM 7785 / NBRC 101032 / NCIMB 13157 / TR-1) TaxID=1227453 RepID=M0LD67_HALJT|nr:hypothetical protein [Haloarcula japonica]EMA31048.1 hypothetical protein C444_09015 [Haloarcula japonica DSM 6131]